MNKFDYYIDAFKNYANFKGRASLAQYWYFVLFNIIISIILNLLHKNIGMLYSMLVLIPALAMGARRLHDINKSGWWQLLILIPFIGSIWLIILFAKKGFSEGNAYAITSPKTEVKDSEELEGLEQSPEGEETLSEDLGEEKTNDE